MLDQARSYCTVALGGAAPSITVIAEWTPQLAGVPNPQTEVTWTIYTDGSWCATGAGTTAILVSPKGQQIPHATHLEFPTTNNVVDYEALLLGLCKAKALWAQRILVKSDSRLMQATLTSHSKPENPSWLDTLLRSGS